MRCEQGYCIVCDKEIAKKCGECGAHRRTGDYTEVLINWSNGSKMSMPVCLACAPDRVWKADKTEMTNAVFKAWDALHHKYDPTIVITH